MTRCCSNGDYPKALCCDKLKVFSVVLLGKDCTRFQYLRSVWFTGFENFGWVREIFCFRWHTTKSKVVRKIKHIPNH